MKERDIFFKGVMLVYHKLAFMKPGIVDRKGLAMREIGEFKKRIRDSKGSLPRCQKDRNL